MAWGLNSTPRLRMALFMALIFCAQSGEASLWVRHPGNLAQMAVAEEADAQSLYLTVLNILRYLPNIVVAIMGIVLIRKAAMFIIDYMTPRLRIAWSSAPAAAAQAKALAEEDDIAKFIAEFRVGPAAPVGSTVSRSQSHEIKNNGKSGADQLKEFFEWAPGQMTKVRQLLGRTGRSATRDEDITPLRDRLTDVGVQIHCLKGRTALPELRPAWQMASALEGLLKQLTDRVGTITPSTMKTLAGAVDVLGGLCAPGLRPDLALNPPIRILVVDDDAVTRFTLGAAVKKVFNQPEFAEHGEEALTLAARQAYDVVFMDVKMPGMDGFEVCSRIHETALNRATPVVFVTGLSDFEARTSSVISGGSDLIAKPFLTFEIAVKALTLVLQSRFKTGDRVVEDSNASVNSGTPATVAQNPVALARKNGLKTSASSVEPPGLQAEQAAVAQDPATLAALAHERPAPARSSTGESDTSIHQAKRIPLPRPPLSARATPLDPDIPKAIPFVGLASGVSGELLAKVSAALEEVRKELGSMGETMDEAGRREKLVVLHLFIQSLARRLEAPGLRPAFQLCSALQGLLKKLQDKPATAVGSTLDTVTAAVEVLGDLCAKGVRQDLVETPAISILVVDDEPLTRRAIVGALQTAFLKPDGTENGEAALALATERPFDVIFLDVEMPGMNGFEVCAKIRETGVNRATPVVFVTSRMDAKARTESARCGGTDFVVKPFLFVEIKVKALTFALHGRLRKVARETAAVC
jgi:CheY-like chemotaxis protein